jgi:hypothetical protein
VTINLTILPVVQQVYEHKTPQTNSDMLLPTLECKNLARFWGRKPFVYLILCQATQFFTSGSFIFVFLQFLSFIMSEYDALLVH